MEKAVGSPSDNDRGWRGAGACFLMYNIEK